MNTIQGLNLPNQYVSDDKKQNADFNRRTIDYYIETALNSSSFRTYVEKIRNVINGVLSEEDYNYVLNPYNSLDPRLKNYPNVLRNYDIITPNIRRFFGEYIMSFHNWTVITSPKENDNQYKSDIEKKVQLALAQSFINNLNSAGFNTGVESKEVPSFETIGNETSTVDEENESSGNDILEFLTYNLETDIQYAKAWFFWITYGFVVTYKYIYRDTVKLEVVPPDEYYPIDNGKDYIEEHDAGLRVQRISIDSIMSNYRDLLEEADITYLQKLIDIDYSKGIPENNYLSLITNSRNEAIGYDFGTKTLGELVDTNKLITDGNRNLDVYHLVYKTPKEIGILKYQDSFGEVHEKEVSTSYKLNKDVGDISISYIYIPELREAFRFGDRYTGIYSKSRPYLVPRAELNNSAKELLPYNGKIGMFHGSFNHSIILAQLPYQALYNIYHLQREREINKWIGQIMTIPKGVLNQDDLSPEAALYYMKADGKVYLDETNPNYKNILEGIKAINVGAYEYIRGMGQILEEIKNEAWDTIDMNRQRFGNTMASDGKGVNQEAIARVSLGTVPITEFFNKFLEREYEGLLDISKMAWILHDDNKPMGNYLNSDKRVASLYINPMQHLGRDYGVFVSNSKEEEDKINQFKQWAFNLTQNNQPELAAMAIDSKNPTKLKNIILKAVELNKQREEALTQQNNQVNLQIQQAKDNNEEANRQNERMIESAKIQRDIYLGELSIQSKNTEGDREKLNDYLSKLNLDREKLNLEQQKINNGKEANNIKRETNRTNYKIAKMNKN